MIPPIEWVDKRMRQLRALHTEAEIAFRADRTAEKHAKLKTLGAKLAGIKEVHAYLTVYDG